MLLCTVLAVSGCSVADDTTAVTEGEVCVRFAVRDADPAVSRAGAVFTAGLPVKVLVFRRSDNAVPASVTGSPYRTFETVTDGTGGLEPAQSGKTLSIMSGYTYDFYALVNPPANETSAGTWNVQHGTDLLAGSFLGKVVSRSDIDVRVDFGDLPHLCSQVQFTAAPSEELLDVVTVNSFSVSKVTWSKLPSWGTFTAGQDRIVTSNSYTGSFELLPTQGAGLEASDFVVGDMGVVLPFPAVYTATTNRIDMKFIMELNGGGVTFDAVNVEVPAFKPGYSYKFIMELQPNENGGAINLMLSVTPWNYLTWVSGMGGDNETETIIRLGSWSSITWRTGMGGDDEVMTILTVSGWRSLTWASIMGD